MNIKELKEKQIKTFKESAKESRVDYINGTVLADTSLGMLIENYIKECQNELIEAVCKESKVDYIDGTVIIILKN